jgi:fatty acid CoA ligase FadD9
MSNSTREERFARHLEDRYANDAQFAAAKPSAAIAEAINQPGLRLP